MAGWATPRISRRAFLPRDPDRPHRPDQWAIDPVAYRRTGVGAAEIVLARGTFYGTRGPGGEMVQRVAIAGFGAIGRVVAEHLDPKSRGGIDGLSLTAVSARDTARAQRVMAGFARTVPVLPLAGLGEAADIVVECAPASVL